MQYADISGHRLAYYREGSGPTIVLVHGITTYSFIWRNIVPFLAQTYDVISVDLLGCGASDKPLDISYAIKDHADYFKTFVDQLGIQQFHFIGHDLGGGIAQIFAVRYATMLQSLTLINSVAYDFWPVQPISAMRIPIIRQLMMASFDLGSFRILIKHGMFHKEKMTDALMTLFNLPMQTSAGRKAFLHFAHCLDNRDLMSIAADLRRLEMPVLIMRGDADPFLSEEVAQKLHAEIPTSRLECIVSAGHFIQEDEPEWVSQHILAFVKRGGAEGA